MGYHPHRLQAKILASDARFRLAVCGRRWGKSLSASWEALSEALASDGRVWVTGLTYEQTDRILEPIWRFLAVHPEVLGQGTRRSERRIVFRGGGFVIGKSADHADSLVGESLTLAVVDEAPIMPERIWQQMLRPCLSDRRGRALLIGTPRGHNWIWDRYSAARRDDTDGKGDPEWYAWRAPTWTNDVKFKGGPEDAEIVSLRDEATRCGMLPLFDQEYGASFTALQGRVYQAFDASRHVIGPMHPPAGVGSQGECHRYIGGIDYGFANPTALVVIGQTGDGGYRVVEEWYERGKTPDEIIASIARLTTKWSIRQWYADPSEPNQILAAVRRGLPVDKALNDVSAGCMAVARHMARPGGFTIARHCTHLLREIESYVWRETAARGVVDEPVKRDDHAVDAMRYAIATEEHASGRVMRSTRIHGL